MFKRKYNSLILIGTIVTSTFLACNDELRLDGGKQNNFADMQSSKLRATIYFMDYEEGPATRFTTDSTDHWSIGPDRVDNKTVSDVTFSDKDTVGIFARWGNMNLPTKDGRGGPLVNIPMYFIKQEYPKDPNKPDGEKVTAYTLENDTVEVFPPAMKSGNGIFMYYPYTPEIGNIENYPNWREYVEEQNYQTGSMYWGTGYTNSTSPQFPNLSGTNSDIFPVIPGLELRVKAPDGSVRCRDVVEMFNASTSDLTKGMISGAVYHGFSEIIVTRGEGFDKPMRKLEDNTLVPDSTIYVVLDKPISHLRVITYSDFVRWTTQLFYKENYTFDGKEMNEEEARKWYAWKGAKYPYTSNMDQSLRKDAWYVIIPSIYHQNNSDSWRENANRIYKSQYSTRPTVSEICLYDNDGYLQHVTSFTLKTSDTASPTKQPYPYYRWPIEIAMDELGPIVRPVTIENWDEDREDKDITDVRTAGIHNIEEYIKWATLYNSFVSSGRVNPDGLEAYGDLIDNVWHFYVSGNDFEGQTLPMVNELQDVFEGNNQFFNVVWSNVKLATPLFGKITKHGGIKNLDLESPYLSYKATENEPVGLFAKDIDINYGSDTEAQTFQNCNVYNGTVISNGPVGLLAGTIQFGRLLNCDFSGRIIGSETSDEPRYLFGTNPVSELKITNISYTNIMKGGQ